ncbi:hypothetical protein E2C01_091110 [Portunus trituberculatus]|uniref:Uncharacterized protein n=1 Tax=Portunus trituberculatus TaxID=210409 RepID=A0A5B7JD49_PORTR|nr:hypothetical protein [Portunus trituberculatus]
MVKKFCSDRRGSVAGRQEEARGGKREGEGSWVRRATRRAREENKERERARERRGGQEGEGKEGRHGKDGNKPSRNS